MCPECNVDFESYRKKAMKTTKVPECKRPTANQEYIRKLAKALLLFPMILFLLSGCTDSLEDGLPGSESDPSYYHSTGWKDNPQHGSDFSTNPLNCKACHGEDLDGGSSGVSCEGCHDETVHHDGNVNPSCNTCHVSIPGPDIAVCGGCHPDCKPGSHPTHITENNKGPDTALGCDDCHDTDNYPNFSDEPDLSDTAVCNNCHSLNGAYNGVDSIDGSIGAKDNWDERVYYSMIPDWQASMAYYTDDFVEYDGNVYRCLADFTSGASFDAGNWTLIDPWQASTAYQTDDVVRYDGNVYRCLADFTSGTSFGASKWELICVALQAAKERWCVGCHDDEPATSQQGGGGPKAPNIAGDEDTLTYGFYVSGHGRPSASKECLDCHDATADHLDGNPRTYVAANNDYVAGYRLNADMIVPRAGEAVGTSFTLCTAGCHAYAKLIDAGITNFKDSAGGQIHHQMHLQDVWAGVPCWDSDWDGTADSGMSCTACHNVHGSPMDDGLGTSYTNPVMIRHGELISTPGSTDKVPALDFSWNTQSDGSGNFTNILSESRQGYIFCDTGGVVTKSHVCWGCHTGNDMTYSRVPN